jgi:hypothetical protein
VRAVEETPNEQLEAWWARLNDEQQAQFLLLEQGDPIPDEYVYVYGLAEILDFGPVGTEWDSDQEDYVHFVDSKLGTFLEAKRQQSA